MLRSINDLEDYTVSATDGDVGHVKDCYFDDEAWVIRYFVVGTGEWLSSRRVLISPLAIGTPSWSDMTLPISITREQVKNSPDIDTDKPVSRQHELEYFGYYGYPYYWGGARLWGAATYPGTVLTGVGYDGIDGESRIGGRTRNRKMVVINPLISTYEALMQSASIACMRATVTLDMLRVCWWMKGRGRYAT